MEANYHSKDFNEISSNHSHGTSDNLDPHHNFTSSDESFNSNSSSSGSDKSFNKKNDVMGSDDLLMSRTSFNGMNNTEARKENHKSFGSIVKMLRNLNLKHEKASREHQHSILRAPTEYAIVRGMSGLNLKVIKSTQQTSNRCHRCIARN